MNFHSLKQTSRLTVSCKKKKNKYNSSHTIWLWKDRFCELVITGACVCTMGFTITEQWKEKYLTLSKEGLRHSTAYHGSIKNRISLPPRPIWAPVKTWFEKCSASWAYDGCLWRISEHSPATWFISLSVSELETSNRGNNWQLADKKVSVFFNHE